MRLLGAILAGGRSSRFGSDKAEALLRGRRLLDRVADALAPQTAALVVAGRDWPGLTRVDDSPAAGLGPLGGLAGALHFARTHGFDAVLSSGCDLPALPADLAARLGLPDALVWDQPTLGLWHAERADALDAFLTTDPRRAIRGWADHVGARRIALPAPPPNINRPEDLARLG